MASVRQAFGHLLDDQHSYQASEQAPSSSRMSDVLRSVNGTASKCKTFLATATEECCPARGTLAGHFTRRLSPSPMPGKRIQQQRAYLPLKRSSPRPQFYREGARALLPSCVRTGLRSSTQPPLQRRLGRLGVIAQRLWIGHRALRREPWWLPRRARRREACGCERHGRGARQLDGRRIRGEKQPRDDAEQHVRGVRQPFRDVRRRSWPWLTP